MKRLKNILGIQNHAKQLTYLSYYSSDYPNYFQYMINKKKYFNKI